MKILTAGNKNYKNWWHGKVVTCTNCQQVVELQAGDENLPTVNMTPGLVTLECSCCGHYARVFEPKIAKVEETTKKLEESMTAAQAAYVAGVTSGQLLRHFRNG